MYPFVKSDALDIKELFQSCPKISYAPGDMIGDYDSASESVCFLEQGIVRASMIGHQGTERLLFYGYPGFIMGDAICFRSQNDPCRAIRTFAVSPCEVAKMSQSRFRKLCQDNPVLAMELVSHAYSKVIGLVEQLEYASFYDTSFQVASLIHALFHEIKETGPSANNAYLLKVTHQMIADATGRTRVSVTYALNRLARLGAIKLHRGRIEVIDEYLLATEAAATAVN